VWTALGKTGSR